MIELNVKGHNDMCSGYNYSGTASFSGKTVKEVLEEIKEFAKGRGQDIGEGFGTLDKSWTRHWGITINDVRYVGAWAGWKNEYKHQFDNWIVEKIEVNGGWYCWYDFNIKCKKPFRKIII